MGKPENVKMPDGEMYLIVQGDPYLNYNEETEKYEIRQIETIFRYEDDGKTFKDCYSNDIILDYDASEKLVFEFKLKGRMKPDFPGNQE